MAVKHRLIPAGESRERAASEERWHESSYVYSQGELAAGALLLSRFRCVSSKRRNFNVLGVFTAAGDLHPCYVAVCDVVKDQSQLDKCLMISSKSIFLNC